MWDTEGEAGFSHIPIGRVNHNSEGRKNWDSERGLTSVHNPPVGNDATPPNASIKSAFLTSIHGKGLTSSRYEVSMKKARMHAPWWT